METKRVKKLRLEVKICQNSHSLLIIVKTYVRAQNLKFTFFILTLILMNVESVNFKTLGSDTGSRKVQIF
jgi:hypothetical protein